MVFLTTWLHWRKTSLFHCCILYFMCLWGHCVEKGLGWTFFFFFAHFLLKKVFARLGTSLVFLTPAQSETGRRAKYSTESSGQLRLGLKISEEWETDQKKEVRRKACRNMTNLIKVWTWTSLLEIRRFWHACLWQAFHKSCASILNA